MNGDDYCELCDLPLSQCPHGQPKPEPVVPAAKAPKTPKPKKAAAPKAPRAKKSTTTAGIVTKTAERRWTSSDELEPLVVQILDAAGGSLANDAVLAQIEERIADSFRAGDRDRTPTGEMRWQLAARKARQSLINQGVMVKERPGVWTLA